MGPHTRSPSALYIKAVEALIEKPNGYIPLKISKFSSEEERNKHLSMAERRVEISDPESEFFASKQETGHEWELFKENVRPLKRGRNVRLLNHALKSHTDHQLRKTLVEKRR